jgi:transcriptional regulator with XRE-family HTH domain
MEKVQFISKFGIRLRQVREEMKLSQTEFGKLIGTTKQNISKWELGLRTPRASTILGIADKVGVNPAWLMGANFDRE